MSRVKSMSQCKHFSFVLPAAAVLFAAAVLVWPLRAQDAPQGPLAPPPEHHVNRIGAVAEPEAPPSLPEAEIVRRFSQKEDEYIVSRTHYTYRKTIRIQEFGPDGQPSGEFVLVTQPGRDADGKLFEKVVEKPISTLPHLFLRSEDLEGLQRVPVFPLTTAQLAKYDLKYLGKEQVDAKYLEIVKTYGKWVTDQGEVRTVADLPFGLFETYRENVDGKYWFPNYTRSDATLNLKGLAIPVRLVIKWTDFKPLPNAAQNAAPATAADTPKP